jgi:catechol 2,3-dioxygenase
MRYHAKIGHVHLKVRQLARAVDFYTHYLGMTVREQVANYAFLSGNEAHHEVALQALGSQAPTPHPYGVGLYHAAFEVADRGQFALAVQALEAGGVDHAAVDHGISWAVYFSDPDGNGLEIYVNTMHELTERDGWDGQTRRLSRAEVLAHLP